jgi:hypothetical protein
MQRRRASADFVWRPTLAGAIWMRSLLVKASTMNSAKSTRLVWLLLAFQLRDVVAKVGVTSRSELAQIDLGQKP